MNRNAKREMYGTLKEILASAGATGVLFAAIFVGLGSGGLAATYFAGAAVAGALAVGASRAELLA